MDTKCSAITKAGKPCRGRALAGSQYCLSHDPESRERLREAQRKGGEGKATSRRLAKQWAALGAELGDSDMPAILKSCMFAVKAGDMTPAEASAIATLAKTAVAITHDTELLERIEALEDATGVKPTPIRKAS